MKTPVQHEAKPQAFNNRVEWGRTLYRSHRFVPGDELALDFILSISMPKAERARKCLIYKNGYDAYINIMDSSKEKYLIYGCIARSEKIVII